jgi:hypothetical protein
MGVLNLIALGDSYGARSWVTALAINRVLLWSKTNKLIVSTAPSEPPVYRKEQNSLRTPAESPEWRPVKRFKQ